MMVGPAWTYGTISSHSEQIFDSVWDSVTENNTLAYDRAHAGLDSIATD